MSDAAIMDKPVGVAEPQATEAPRSAFDQFTGLFGFGKKPSEQPTPPLTAPVQSPDLATAGLPTTDLAPKPTSDATLNPTTPPAIESIPSSSPPASEPVAQLDPSIKTVDDLLAQGPQIVEASPPSEQQTPAEKAERLRQQIAASVDAFLEEVTKEKVAA